MRYLLFVKGDGRGHLTQTLSLCQLLRDNGHEIAAVIIGAPAEAQVPAFIFERAGCPVIRLESPNLMLNRKGDRIDWLRTIVTGTRQLGRYLASLRQIRELLTQYPADAVINLYEPLVRLYGLRYGNLPPVVNISHQNLMLHPQFAFPPDRRLERSMVRNYTAFLCPPGSKTLSLSFYELPDHQPGHNYVVAPLLRREVFERTATNDGHLLVYMVYPGIAEQVKAFNQQHPEQRIHAFWSRKDVPNPLEVSPTLTFHHIHETLFLDLLASAKGVATTAGFETVCEAFYLRKPAILLPMPGQYEQYLNAWDAEKVGAGKHVNALDPTLLDAFIPQYAPQHEAYIAWLDAGRQRLLWHLEQPATLHSAPQPHVQPNATAHAQA